MPLSRPVSSQAASSSGHPATKDKESFLRYPVLDELSFWPGTPAEGVVAGLTTYSFRPRVMSMAERPEAPTTAALERGPARPAAGGGQSLFPGAGWERSDLRAERVFLGASIERAGLF